MNRLHKFFLSFIILFFVFQSSVLAKSSVNFDFEKLEYAEEYKNWLALPEEERGKTLPPNKYNIISNNKKIVNSTNNPISINRILKNSVQSKFSLKDVLGDSIKIKNQGNTNTCWAFATLGTLESTLSYQDYKNNNTIKEYDFSERHMVYSNSRNAFFNNQINEYGYTRNIKEGSNYYLAMNYLTNGRGAILESDMPFIDNLDNIDISEIENKNVVTTIYDTQEFGIENREELISEMKSYLSNYGGLYAQIHGANLDDSKYYNNQTGAICTDSQASMDHAIVIIGWDDEYSRENFNENCRPQNNGAWIIKNSWGEKLEIELDEIKKLNYLTNEAEYKQMGINDYTELPDEFFIQMLTESGYTPNSDNSVFLLAVGDNGYMYVSYEDALIYQNVYGIKKASSTKDYDKIYQNDILGWSNIIVSNYSGNVYIANSFARDQSSSEKLRRVSIYTPVALKNCKVYVNPNGTDKAKENLQEAVLKEGNIDNNTINIDAGYHSVEFSNPIELNSDGFVVILEMNSSEDVTYIALESVEDGGWENAVVNENESFYTVGDGFENNEWIDIGSLPQANLKGNVTLKAYTDKLENDENKTDDNKEDENTTDNKDEKEQEENNKKQPKSSDFSKATATLDNIELSETIRKIYINVKNIWIGDEEDNYTYYYCITGSTSNDNINENYWIQVPTENISKQMDGTYTIALEIDIEKQKNLVEWFLADKLYLHIKEIAELNGQKLEAINGFDIQINSNEVPSDEDKKDNSNSNTDNKADTNNNTNQNSTNENTSSVPANDVSKDATVANVILPYTGKVHILIAIILLIVFGGFLYYKYRNIDR